MRSVKSHDQRRRKYYLSRKHNKETLLTTHDAINTKTEIWIEDQNIKRNESQKSYGEKLNKRKKMKATYSFKEHKCGAGTGYHHQ